MKKYLILLLALVPLFITCVKREWANPYDPACPKELWTPSNFKAVQNGTSVTLSWTQPMNNIAGFKLTKKVDTGAATDLTPQAKGITSLADPTLTGGKLHTYTVVAYAGNNQSNVVTTTFTPILPAGGITTLGAISITAISAFSGATISTDGGSAITAKGVCWATTTGPTIAGSKTTDGTGTGTYASLIVGLSANTLYYVRAYATNSVGTTYGTEISFRTLTGISTITTTAISNITGLTATSGGNITADGGAAITARGVCWSTATGPTIAGSKTTDGTGIGSYISSLTGLSPGTTYYLRTYATNSTTTTYGNEISFITPAVVASITTTAASLITATTASGGGSITTDGGAAVSARGICWGTISGPTVSNGKTMEGTGIGSFTSSLVGLSPNTNYYVRAYATNNVGTTYGNEISFKTLTGISALTTTNITAITSNTSAGGGNITNDGGATITARGVVWNTSSNPTTANSKTTDGSGIGTFTSSITGLIGGSTYYVRAYATNVIGTNYGTEVSFKTASVMSTLTTSAISISSNISATCGGVISNDGGSAVTARGICWNTTTIPTISNSKTVDGSGTGVYTSNITNLIAGVTYYVRSYATNSIGTAYGNEINFKIPVSAINFNTGLTYGNIADIEGNSYKTIEIGTQKWMAENLRTTKYNDGTTIPIVTDNTAWDNLTTPAYCWNNNDATTYKSTFGAMYNWYTVNTGRLCPTGWHAPSYGEWATLRDYLGGLPVAGGKIKESGTNHWVTPNTGAANSSGLSILPGGLRNTNEFGYYGWYWSTQSGACIRIPYDYPEFWIYGIGNSGGASVRCLADGITVPSITTSSVASVTSTSATAGGNVTSDGGLTLSARGVCWSTSTNPTTANSKTTDGTGIGSFTSSITGLIASTTYYFRAYATNSIGTSYGNEIILVNKGGDGSSNTKAGTSASQIKTDFPNSVDGVYWINLPNVGPTQIYCIMNSACDGGGWMLAMKATTGTTFNYGSNYWITSNTLNQTDNTRNAGDAKYATMNNFQAKDLMALWPDIPSKYNSSTTGGSINLSAIYNNWCWLQNNFKSGIRITLISFFATVNNSLVSDANLFAGKGTAFSGQSDVRFYGFNYTGNSNARTRWGFGWNENGGGLYPNGDQSTNDVSGGIGMDAGFGSYSAGDLIGCCQNSTGINRSARVEVYIR